MPQVKVTVYCIHEEDIEMKGADTIYENKDTRTQSRRYECPHCDRETIVDLDFRGN